MVCALSIKLVQLVVKIGLELLNTRVDLLSKCFRIELVENGFMESLNNPIRLWVTRFSSCVLYLVKCKI